MKTNPSFLLVAFLSTLVSVGAAPAWAQDMDFDGFPDDVDNCPLDYNPGQEDSDCDGIGNDCDFNPGVCGGCVTNADCNDGVFCTMDTCLTGNCVYPARNCNDGNDCTDDFCNEGTNTCDHPPRNAGTACGDPSNTTCTDPDACNASGVCLRNDAANGTACTAPNVCIGGESCNSGFCVGTWQTNCCQGQADCNDHNACTQDACLLNICFHNNAAAGTPCGSSVDDDCTNPDTCDPNGNCLAMDTSDGQDCGGPDCLAGQCGPTKYQAQMMPEGNFIGSEPRDGFVSEISGDLIVVGRVIDAGQGDHAAVWTCDANGANCTLEVFEEQDGSASVANSVACDGQGTCSFVEDIMSGMFATAGPSKGNEATRQQGNEADHPQTLLGKEGGSGAVAQGGATVRPQAWVKTGGGPWTAETMPLPAGFGGGSAGFVDGILSDLLAWGGSKGNKATRQQGNEADHPQPLLVKERGSGAVTQGGAGAFAAVGYGVNAGGDRKVAG